MFMAEEKEIIKRVNEILARDPQLIDETVNELIEKGVRKGAFQDHALICDIIGLLGYIAAVAGFQQIRRTKKGENK